MNESITQESTALHPYLDRLQKRALAVGILGLLATAVLNVNNVRDIHSDARHGKMTLAVGTSPQTRFGEELLFHLALFAKVDLGLEGVNLLGQLSGNLI